MKTILAGLVTSLMFATIFGLLIPCWTLEARVRNSLQSRHFVEAIREAELVYRSQPCLCSASARRLIVTGVMEAVPALSSNDDPNFTQAKVLLIHNWNEVNTGGEAARLVRGLQERELQFIRSSADPLRALAESNSAREFFDDEQFRKDLDREQPGLLLRAAAIQIERNRQEDAIASIRQLMSHSETSSTQWEAGQDLASRAAEGIVRAAVNEKNYQKAFAALDSLGNEFPGAKRIVDAFDTEVFGRSVEGATAITPPVEKSLNASNVAQLSIRNPSHEARYSVVLRGRTSAEVDVPPDATAKVTMAPGPYVMAAFGGDGRIYRTVFVVASGAYEQTIKPASDFLKGGTL
jgi:hypothetical protein